MLSSSCKLEKRWCAGTELRKKKNKNNMFSLYKKTRIKTIQQN